jgi:hypothetical protein
MKKRLIVVVILIIGTIGFLTYDWHVKTKLHEDDQRVTLYSWTDEKGAIHFTDTQPPNGVRKLKDFKGFKYADQPWVVKIKDKAIDGYKWVKKKLFKTKKQ